MLHVSSTTSDLNHHFPGSPSLPDKIVMPTGEFGVVLSSGSIYKLRMDSEHTELRIELGNSLKGLTGALGELAEHIRTDARAIWMWVPGGSDLPRVAIPALSRAKALEAAGRAFLTIKYDDDQDAHESRIAPGLIVLSPAGIRLVDDVNYWKDRLAKALKAMDGIQVDGVVDQDTGERGPRPLREVALERLYFRRLHYYQAVRKIVVLRESAEHIGTPDYVSYSWGICRAVRRTSREAVLEELSGRLAAGKGSPRLLERDIALLKRLPEGEPIAVVRKAPPTVKANVRWPSREGQPPLRRMCSAVAPLVMLGETLPSQFRALPAKPLPSPARLARSDTELEGKPFLCTLPAFRYLRQHRNAKRGESA